MSVKKSLLYKDFNDLYVGVFVQIDDIRLQHRRRLCWRIHRFSVLILILPGDTTLPTSPVLRSTRVPSAYIAMLSTKRSTMNGSKRVPELFFIYSAATCGSSRFLYTLSDVSAS